MYEDIKYIKTYSSVIDEKNKVGNDGLVAVVTPGSPVKELIEFYIGLENFYYLLYDHPKEIKSVVQLMTERDLEAFKIAARSPADFLLVDEDTGTGLYSTKIFEEMVKPILKKFVDIAHINNKLIAFHSCGLLNGILESIKETGVDIIESMTPFPTGNIDMLNAKQKLGSRICLIGGIDPTLIVINDKSYLINYIKDLLIKMKSGGNFILANGDALPANTPIENLNTIYHCIEKYGYY
jgi:uroporphyrinogen-III decarboxylase